MRRLVPLFVVLTLMWSSAAQARKVRIRGGAILYAHVRVLEGGTIELTGRLADDDHTAIEGAWIELRARGGLKLTEAVACASPRVSVAPLKGGLKVQAAADGEICLRFEESAPKGTIELRFPGDPYHGSASISVDFDRAKPSRRPTRLRVVPRPTIISLDKGKIILSAVLEVGQGRRMAPVHKQQIHLLDGDGKLIADARTGGDGKARFELTTKQLGGPGTGKLTAKFDGDASLSPAKDELVLTRQVTVRLSLGGPVEPTDAGDEAPLPIVAAANVGHIEGGVVEALIHGRSVATAPVKDGKALLRVPVAPRAQKTTRVAVRYLSSSPWYRAGPPLAVVIPVAPPSMTLRIVLVLLVLSAGAWVIVSWRRSKQRPRRDRTKIALPPGVHVVRSTRGAKSWHGTVIDAHDGSPLLDVEIVVRHPSFEDDGVLVRTATDRYGKFAFDLGDRPEGAELVAQSETHSAEKKLLPPGGELRIALVTRRRAILRRFVSWAKFRGPPYDIDPEPTPGHVKDVSRGRPAVEQWASEVEAAAFGPGVVDRSAEEHLRDGAPD